EIGRYEIEPRGDESLERGRHLHRGATRRRDPPALLLLDASRLHEHPQEFLDEERVPFGAIHDLGAQRFGERINGKERGDELPGVARGEWRQCTRRRVRQTASPRGRGLTEFRTS